MPAARPAAAARDASVIVDAATPERAVFAGDFDVCVVGTGPAGISLARSLAARGLRVALMEGGGLEWSPESQGIYLGEITGLDTHELDGARLRYFGGTSGHWNGFTRIFDAPDFDPRPGNPGSGWPIGKADLDPYLAEAGAVLELPDADFSDLPPSVDRFRNVSYRFSPPTQFGTVYLDEIAASGRIVAGFHANLVDLRLDDGLTRVEEARFRSFEAGDPGFSVRARAVCLATGGIENARLLLNFDSQIATGIGNGHDLVGRYFMDHPSVHVGEALLREPLEQGRDNRFFCVPTEALLAEHGTLPLVLMIGRMPPLSFRDEFPREVQCRLPFADRLYEAVTGEPPRVCDRGGLAAWWRRRGPANTLAGQVLVNSEQSLNPDSRVTLGEERDAFGLRRPRLHWALRDIDYRSIATGALALAEEMANADMGRMRLYDWILAEDPVLPPTNSAYGNISARHHMGTTRMSDDARAGVVDRDCRVHGIENLYIGGSSVFASSSFVNPTLTIVQLALRLGDHLGDTLKG